MSGNDVNESENGEENVMSIFETVKQYEINSHEAETVVKKPSYVEKFHLSLAERQKRALNVLNKWK